MLAYGNGSEEGNVPEEKEDLKRIGHCWLMGMEVRNRMRSSAFFSATALHQTRPLKDLYLVQSRSAGFGSCKSFKFGRQRKATSQQKSCK